MQDFALRPRKANDHVSRETVWKVREEYGVRGIVTKSNSEITSEHDWASVRVGGGKSSQFEVNKSVTTKD